MWLYLEYGEKQIPPPLPLKQLEDVLHEQLYNILLETCQNLYESIPKGYKLYYRQMLAQLHINKEICISHNWFHIMFIPSEVVMTTQTLLAINVYYIPTNAQISSVNLYSITPTCFGVSTPSSGS